MPSFTFSKAIGVGIQVFPGHVPVPGLYVQYPCFIGSVMNYSQRKLCEKNSMATRRTKTLSTNMFELKLFKQSESKKKV